MARNMFADPFQTGMDAFDAGYERQQRATDQGTRVRAGRQLATGDRSGAGATFASAGLIPEARQMGADQNAEEDRGMRLADDATARTEHGEDRQHADVQRKAGELKQLTAALRQVPKGQRAPFLQHALPILQQATGMDISKFQALSEDDLTDEQLAAFDGEVDKHVMINLGAGGVADFNPRTGELKTLREPSKPLILGNGASAYDADGNVIARNAKTFAPRAPRGSGSSGVPSGFVLD